MSVRKILIGGEWVEADDSFEVRNPFNGELLANVSEAGDDLNERSLAAASDAAKKMRDLPRFRIAKGLRAISDRIAARKDEFVRSIALESAKPLMYARGEVERAIANFSWAAGEAERFTGEIVPLDVQASGKGKWGRTMRVPRGVIYGITPFNFPLNLVAHKVGPALASGNAIIIKPSSRTPLTALLLGEVFLDCGLPEAALQVVPTDVKNVDAIITDERIAMVSFTGSAAVGWDLRSKAAKKPVALELGGNAPVIVDESADHERSLSRTVTGAFAYSGQVCISVQRVYVHSSRFDDWTEEFIKRSRKLVTGDPLDEKTQLSVMIDEDAAKRSESWVEEAASNGAKVLLGGDRDGAHLSATVLTNTDPEMRVVSEEVFAPIAVVERFDRFEDAIEMANNSKYGLQAGVFSNNGSNIERAAERLEYGGVIINDAPIFRVDNMPYGGMKESGFGREGVRYAMEEMSEIKLVVHEK
ncbi:MAG TPA: aldehyde dehydrogenase family protein [Pyrinomonadaceae bacterium]